MLTDGIRFSVRSNILTGAIRCRLYYCKETPEPKVRVYALPPVSSDVPLARPYKAASYRY